MPIGLQCIAPYGEDLRTLAVCHEVERSTDRRRPRISHDLLG
jgi:Asp-tRNA(Asn)/Glu-tRNA(Gln) amidotransferase A subunit family amidase